MRRVYVLAARDGTIKVGMSIDPDARVVSLSPKRGPLKVVHATEICERATFIERTAHRFLEIAGKRVEGEREWFTATEEEGVAAVRRAMLVAQGLEPPPPRRPKPPRKHQYSVLVAMTEEEYVLLDDLRCLESDLPRRSEMVRRLIRNAAEVITEKPRWQNLKNPQ